MAEDTLVLDGIRFKNGEELAAAKRDKRRIERLTQGLDLNDPEDIEKLYNSMQGSDIFFESRLGRDFDDNVYELMQKVKRGVITENSGKASKKSLKAVRGKASEHVREKKDEAERLKNKYGDKINSLVERELIRREKRRRLLTVLAALIAVASLGYFGYYYFQSSRTSSDMEDLASLKGSEALKNSASQEKNTFTLNKQSIKLPDILDDYATLYAKNKRLAGWLKIGGTNIDYPVMQTDDNEYYLTHNFNQEKDNNGSLFLDCACELYPRSTNMIIYGHHMKSGNMFGNLQKYAKESYGKEHSTITFDTIYEKATYQVMYVFYSKVYENDDLVFKYYQFINANSETEFNYYMDEMQKLSLYDTGISAEYGDSLLTLSTCDHSQTDGRFAVVAKRIS